MKDQRSMMRVNDEDMKRMRQQKERRRNKLGFWKNERLKRILSFLGNLSPIYIQLLFDLKPPNPMFHLHIL